MRCTTKWSCLFLTSTLALGSLAVPASAQESSPAADQLATEAQEQGWSLDAGVDWSERYVFRGVDLLGEDHGILQPYATFGAGGFSVWYFGYFGTFERVGGADGDYTEHDLGADYTFGMGAASLKVGALTYVYPREVEDGLGFHDTSEAYAYLSFDAPLSPTISYWYDFDVVNGGYAQIAVSQSFALGSRASLDLSGALGLDFGYNSLDSNGDLNDVLLGVNVPFRINDTFAAHAKVQRSIALDVLDDRGQGDVTILTVGVSASF